MIVGHTVGFWTEKIQKGNKFEELMVLDGCFIIGAFPVIKSTIAPDPDEPILCVVEVHFVHA